MTTPAETAPEQEKMSMAARIGWIALVCVTLYVCYFSHLGAIGFVGPDEPRYAWIARAMVETGDWVTPRLYDKPWFEKPPLYYWSAAICFKLFGVNEAAARLPSAISALLATLAMAWLAWRVYGAETARWLLILLPTTVGMIGFSHAAATDMPFSGMLTVAMVCAAVVIGLTERNPEDGLAQHAAPLQRDRTTRSRLLAAILFGLFLGLAVLAKGPAGIILCGGAVFFWALFTKRWRDALRLLHPAGIAVFCATALPWYILCSRRNPDFFRIFIIEHNFKRYLTPEFQHIQPFWFYVPVLLVALLPWTLGLASISTRTVLLLPLQLFFLCFGAFPFAFFSASQSKLPGYVLPSVPPIVCLVALSRVIVSKRRREIASLSFAIAACTLAIALVGYAATHPLGSDALPAGWTFRVCVPMLLGGLVGVLMFARGYALRAAYSTQIGVMLAVWALASGISTLDAQFSARGAITRSSLDGRQLAAQDVFAYDLPRGIHYGLNFYLHREIPEWSNNVLNPVFTSRIGQSRLIQQGYTCDRQFLPIAVLLCRNLSAGAADGKAQ